MNHPSAYLSIQLSLCGAITRASSVQFSTPGHSEGSLLRSHGVKLGQVTFWLISPECKWSVIDMSLHVEGCRALCDLVASLWALALGQWGTGWRTSACCLAQPTEDLVLFITTSEGEWVKYDTISQAILIVLYFFFKLTVCKLLCFIIWNKTFPKYLASDLRNANVIYSLWRDTYWTHNSEPGFVNKGEHKRSNLLLRARQ
jgi:hypothetical protein